MPARVPARSGREKSRRSPGTVPFRERDSESHVGRGRSCGIRPGHFRAVQVTSPVPAWPPSAREPKESSGPHPPGVMSIFRLERFAVQTIRPGVSRKKNAFFPYTSGRTALCRRLGRRHPQRQGAHAAKNAFTGQVGQILSPFELRRHGRRMFWRRMFRQVAGTVILQRRRTGGDCTYHKTGAARRA